MLRSDAVGKTAWQTSAILADPETKAEPIDVATSCNPPAPAGVPERDLFFEAMTANSVR
jgi:hypothetical protein